MSRIYNGEPTSKSFFITTAPTANHTILGWAKTATESEAMAVAEIERAKLGIDPDNLDTNDVHFVVKDGEVEKLARVDGGAFYWSLGNCDVRQLARDIAALNPGLI